MRSGPGSPDESLTPFLIDLLERWSTGRLTPAAMMTLAHDRWESRAWPEPPEDDPADAPIVVLQQLAHARENSLAVEDVPALLAILRSPDGRVWQRLGEHFETILGDERDRLMQSGYYGRGTEQEFVAPESALRSPEKRRLHRGVREDPESVWDDLRARICQDPDDFAADIVDDLLFHHAEAFADRVAALADECPDSRELIASIHTGDKDDSPAMARFEAKRRRLEDQLVAAGVLTVWRAEEKVSEDD
jgi:hypothetical protein